MAPMLAHAAEKLTEVIVCDCGMITSHRCPLGDRFQQFPGGVVPTGRYSIRSDKVQEVLPNARSLGERYNACGFTGIIFAIHRQFTKINSHAQGGGSVHVSLFGVSYVRAVSAGSLVADGNQVIAAGPNAVKAASVNVGRSMSIGSAEPIRHADNCWQAAKTRLSNERSNPFKGALSD